MRRVVVTPTFAAGLGVVVAAVLAFHVTRTVFRYSAPDWGGQRCPTSGCSNSRHQGAQPDLVTPGTPLPAASPSTPPPLEAPESTPSPAGPSGRVPAPSAMTYQTDREWPGGFVGRITVTFAGGAVPAHWGLWFSYPTHQIYGVLGGQWQAEGGHAASVSGAGPQPGSPSAGAIQIEFWVSGTAGPPPGCSFDHAACHFS
jgi:Cellulose binding domain